MRKILHTIAYKPKRFALMGHPRHPHFASLENKSFSVWPPGGSGQEIGISTKPIELVVLALVQGAQKKLLLNSHSTRFERHHDSGENKITQLSYGIFFVVVVVSFFVALTTSLGSIE